MLDLQGRREVHEIVGVDRRRPGKAKRLKRGREDLPNAVDGFADQAADVIGLSAEPHGERLDFLATRRVPQFRSAPRDRQNQQQVRQSLHGAMLPGWSVALTRRSKAASSLSTTQTSSS